ncbi:MAG: TonB family protein [Magnetococcales bacterium]|nr:TonB family protein [Magnetococcales bacterium]
MNTPDPSLPAEPLLDDPALPNPAEPTLPAPNRFYFRLALALSLLFHLLLLVRLEWDATQQTPKTDLTPIPVQLVRMAPPATKTAAPPREPDQPAIADETAPILQEMIRENLQESTPPPADPTPAPPPPAPPTDPTPAPPPPEAPVVPAPQATRPKSKPPAPTGKSKPPVVAAPTALPTPDKPAAGPLNLAPGLRDLTRWDQERTERARQEIFKAQEETVNLDTPKPRYSSYFARLKEQIQQGWIYPTQAKREGLAGALSLRFTIERSGMITDIRVLNSSGVAILDEAALQAVRNITPFLPLPDDWELEKLHVKTIFEYVRGGFQWRR